MPTQLQALEAFADTAQNPDFLRLEALLSRFNLFEAIGVIKQELRHSDLLAALLDPNQRHGLGTAFLRELLRDVLLTTERESVVTQTELDLWNLNQIAVSREWHYIDILVLDEVNHFAVIIENKIDTGQGPDQLERYYEYFLSLYPNYKVIALYLTRDGHYANDDRYFAVSYTQVCQVIEKIVQQHRDTLETDTVVLLDHYAQMLRRHIVSDSDVAKLCRSIYQQHKQALDLIFEHGPPPPTQIRDYLVSLIQQQPVVKLTDEGKNWINFAPVEWESAPLFHQPYSQGSQDRQWLLYLQFKSDSSKLDMIMGLALGNQADRQMLFHMARTNGLQGCAPVLSTSWLTLFKKSFLIAKDYEKTQEEIEAIISQRWAEFLRDDLHQITQAIREEKWLWELP